MKTLTMLEFRRNARKALNTILRGESLLLTYRGKPVARMEPIEAAAMPVPDNDPLLRLDDFAVEGPGGRIESDEIDRIVYGS